MSYVVVYERNPQEDGLGGNRVRTEYSSESEFEQKLMMGSTVIAQGITWEDAEKLCCQAQDICLILAVLNEVFDQTGKSIQSRVSASLFKSQLAIEEVHRIRDLYDLQTAEFLPNNLNNLGSPFVGGLTDKQYFFRLMVEMLPTGNVECISDFFMDLEGLFRIHVHDRK